MDVCCITIISMRFGKDKPSVSCPTDDIETPHTNHKNTNSTDQAKALEVLQFLKSRLHLRILVRV